MVEAPPTQSSKSGSLPNERITDTMFSNHTSKESYGKQGPFGSLHTNERSQVVSSQKFDCFLH